jgi:hypothetical protein
MRQPALPKVRCSPGHRANQTQASSRQDLKRLALLFSVSIILTFWLAGGRATAEMLFQSPQSPVPEQPAQQAPPAQPQPEQPPAQPQPTEPPPVEQAPAEQQPVETQPIEQQPAESEQTEQTGTNQSTTDEPATGVETPVEPVEETGNEPPIPEEPAPEAEPFGPEPVDLNEDLSTGDEAGARNFILDRIELIDSVVVSTAYVWLCCGVLLFLLVPVFMLFLYLRGRSQIAREEGF